MFTNEMFSERLAELRIKKGVSARDMSLSIGQGPGYINNIENGHNLPSMSVFFYICDYLDVEPSEFFDDGNNNPVELNNLINIMKTMSDTKLNAIATIVEQMK